jgi:hypothetical protein
MINNLTTYENTKCGLHILAPYVGKVRPQLANHLISQYSNENSVIIDPFCGSGTIALEGWISKREVIANDLNPYAVCITKGKLFPCKTVEAANKKLIKYSNIVNSNWSNVNINNVPAWVKIFYHKRTLKEIILWVELLLKANEYFLLSNLLGIMHHQRPGFLSFPSSHGAPYLRNNNFPKIDFPEMYKYRNVFERLSQKVKRSFKNIPSLDYSLKRTVRRCCASKCLNNVLQSNTIITSPPYMKSLTYARDNRLRLWFLGYPGWSDMEKNISPSKSGFKILMKNAMSMWFKYQKKGDYCIIIIGDLSIDKKTTISEFVYKTAEDAGYKLKDILIDPIPDSKRMVKKESKIKTEEIIVLKREK